MLPEQIEREREHPALFKIRVTFNADDKPLEIRLEEQMAQVLIDAINLFGLTSQPHTMGLFTEANVQVAGRKPDGQDIQQTVQQAGLKPGQLLVLRQVVVSGGRT
jgi:hypothetical protein